MSTKTKTTTAAAIAALALPSAALAHDGHGAGKSRSDDGTTTQQQRGAEHANGTKDHGWHKGWTKGKRSFVLFGTKASGLSVTDGKLGGPITLDPRSGNKAARIFLKLTR